MAGRWQQNKREDEVVSYKLGSVSQVQDPSSQQHLLDYLLGAHCVPVSALHAWVTPVAVDKTSNSLPFYGR